MSLPIANVTVGEVRVDPADFKRKMWSGAAWITVPNEVSMDEDGTQNVDVVTAYHAENDAFKVLATGQTHYDLIVDEFTVPANSQETVPDGSNYTMSLTGAWILHPLIKHATKVQVYGNFSRSTQVKLYVAPNENPDQNTPEYAYRGDGESEWMFKDKSGGAFAISFPSCSRIVPISASALKFYIRNEDATNAETLKLVIRLIFD